MSPRERKNQKLVAIFQALIELMRIKEVNSISITELTRKAGVSRTYYYNNFTTFDDIISEFEMLSIIRYLRHLPNHGQLRFSILMEHYFQLALNNIASQETLLQAGKEQVLIRSFVTTYQYLLQNELLTSSGKNSRIGDKYWADFIAGAVINTSLSWLLDGARETPKYMGQKLAAFLELA